MCSVFTDVLVKLPATIYRVIELVYVDAEVTGRCKCVLYRKVAGILYSPEHNGFECWG
jgi:hypothetical protein